MMFIRRVENQLFRDNIRDVTQTHFSYCADKSFCELGDPTRAAQYGDRRVKS